MDWGPHSSNTYGRKPMELRGPFYDPRHRVNPEREFNDLDRTWRKQWLKDQKLSPRDSKIHPADIFYHPEHQKARLNIIRRIIRAPMDFVEINFLRKIVPGDVKMNANLVRSMITISARTYIAFVGLAYVLRHSTTDWTDPGGFKFESLRPRLLPGDPGFPHDSVVRGDLKTFPKGFEESKL